MKTFKQAWAEKEAAGYQYGRDDLELVRLGWNMRDAEAPTGLTRAQAVAILERTIRFSETTVTPREARGARMLLRALTEAGAFTDGKNWNDRPPVQPGEFGREFGRRSGREPVAQTIAREAAPARTPARGWTRKEIADVLGYRREPPPGSIVDPPYTRARRVLRGV